jgi:thymidylate synthase
MSQPEQPQIVTASIAWATLMRDLLVHGSEESPRGMPTLELLSYQSVVDMRYPIVNIAARKLNYKFMAAEAWWILEGRDDAESIGRHCKAITEFADLDEGRRFFGAYGPKILDQINHVVDTLSQDPSSRQAVINIWRENPIVTKDVPCTLSVQWVIRGGCLICIDTMRSSDAWLGWPYDVFNFSMLSWHILEMLRLRGMSLELGTLGLNAGSQHLYVKDAEKVKDWNQNILEETAADLLIPAGDPLIESEMASSGEVVATELGCCIGEDPFDRTPGNPFFQEFMTKLISK